MNEVVRHSGKMIWEELREFPGKGEAAVLRDEGKGKARTIIVRLPARRTNRSPWPCGNRPTLRAGRRM